MSENKNNIQYIGSSEKGDLYVQWGEEGKGIDGGGRCTTVFTDGSMGTVEFTNNGPVRVENPPAALLEEAKLTAEKEKQK